MAEIMITPGVPGIGARQVRLEDEPLLTGRAKYTGDLAVDAVTHAVFVRSPFAHARVTSIDTSAAERAAGASVRGFFASGLPGPKGNIETFVALAEAARGTVGGLEALALAADPG